MTRRRPAPGHEQIMFLQITFDCWCRSVRRTRSAGCNLPADGSSSAGGDSQPPACPGAQPGSAGALLWAALGGEAQPCGRAGPPPEVAIPPTAEAPLAGEPQPCSWEGLPLGSAGPLTGEPQPCGSGGRPPDAEPRRLLCESGPRADALGTTRAG